MNKLRKLEDKQVKLENRIPYLEEKMNKRHQHQIDKLDYKQKQKLLILEQNALGKEYYEYLKDEKIQEQRHDLYGKLQEAQQEVDKLEQQQNEQTTALTRLDAFKVNIENTRNGLGANKITNQSNIILVDDDSVESYEKDIIKKLEGHRDSLQVEITKTQTALDQLVREERDESSLYRKYEDELADFIHGYSLVNDLLGVIVADGELPTFSQTGEVSSNLKKTSQILDEALSEVNRQKALIEEKQISDEEVSTLRNTHEQKVKEIFDAYDEVAKSIEVEFSEDKYEAWQKQHNTLNVTGSAQQIVESNKKEYDRQQALADEEMNKLVTSLNEQKQQKIDSVEPKIKSQLQDLDKEIEEVKKEIDQETGQTVNNLRNKADQLTNPQEQTQFKQVLDMVDNPEDNTQLFVSNLTMQFGGLKAVNDLSFHVNRNEIYGLIGPNGAGKTTVFNCITQFYKVTDGTMLFKNDQGQLINLTDYKVHEVIEHGIVRTFQNIELIGEISILDNMLVGAHSSYRTGFFEHLLHLPALQAEEFQKRTRALQILEKLGLSDVQDQQPVGLPYGVLKRIELARTLMLEPKLIILDEPAAGLNEAETLELAELIRDIRDTFDVTIFLVEHDMGLVMSVCDRITAISFGKHLATGSPSEIQNHPLVQEAYLGGQGNE